MKPRFEAIPFEQGCAWRGAAGWSYQQKIDGQWCEATLANGAQLVGELTQDGTLWAFDLCAHPEQGDLRRTPLGRRFELLRSQVASAPDLTGQPFERLQIVPTGNGGEFLEAVIAHGGEGVVAKRLDGLWGDVWFKCKRRQVFRCVVTDIDALRGSVRLQTPAGRDGGWLALRRRLDAVRLGSVLKVEAYGEHASGRLREARLDKDTPDSWLVSY
jgi:hypothetical protein